MSKQLAAKVAGAVSITAAAVAIFNPVGLMALLGVTTIAGSVGAASGLGALGGGVLGWMTDKLRTRARARVVQIFGPYQSGKNSVFNMICGIRSDSDPQPTTPGTNSVYKNEIGKVLRRIDLSILEGTTGEADDQFIDIREVSGEETG